MASLAGMLQAGIASPLGCGGTYHPIGKCAAAYRDSADAAVLGNLNLTPRPDLVIVGNAISRGNVELEHVLDTRIRFTSMAAVLHDEFLEERESLVDFTGTHGKTTTTSMPGLDL